MVERDKRKMITTRHITTIALIVTGGVLILGALFLYIRYDDVKTHMPVLTSSNIEPQSSLWNDPTVSSASILGGTDPITVTIARTEADQNHGLSDTASLPEYAGKLFVFNMPGNYGFWMKDMKYSLDFVWINKNYQIVDITKNISPNTYPEVFYPPVPIQYVLEINAGLSTENNFQVGQTLSLQK